MQKTILIVDFEQRAIEELEEILKGEDFSVLTAADGNEALGVFQSSPPDLVLATALLPKLSGFELCKKITSGELGEARPVIMYSAIYKAEKYRKEAVAGCGALEFLDTPIPKWQLLKTIRAAFTVVPVGKPDVSEQSPPLAAVGSDDSILAPDESAQEPVGETGDVLEIDLQLPVSPTVLTGQRAAPDSKPWLMPSIDNSEIDAAMDSVRVDLHQEARHRDELLAREVEQELLNDGHGVLEFEGPAQKHSPHTDQRSSEHLTQEFELDEVLPELEPLPDSAPLSADAEKTPSFSTPAQPRNWVPFVVLIVVALLASLVFWLRG